MKTNTITPDDGTDLRDPSPTTLFEAFASPRRQLLLQYLAHRPGAVLLGDVAEYIPSRKENRRATATSGSSSASLTSTFRIW
ncbi:hypothetical protein [Natronorubrum sp. FCH18a]|uniref:hypothetical protein n=1 Tax=Natronorubrum sp. FCH18a TaxID=3447018 RepID=UPI003F5145A9